MFGGSAELLLILIVALVVVGPAKLPDLIRAFGKGLSEFRRMSSDVKATLERELERAEELKRIGEIKQELFDEADKAGKSLSGMAQDVEGQLRQSVETPEPGRLTLDVADETVAETSAQAESAVATAPEGRADAPAAPAEASPASPSEVAEASPAAAAAEADTVVRADAPAAPEGSASQNRPASPTSKAGEDKPHA